MIILEIGNLAPVGYYNKETRKFHFEACISAVKQLGQRYSGKFGEVVEKMLIMDFKSRPRLEEIIDSIEQKTVYTASSGNTEHSSSHKGLHLSHEKQSSAPQLHPPPKVYDLIPYQQSS
jgi:hypothetical protein